MTAQQRDAAGQFWVLLCGNVWESAGISFLKNTWWCKTGRTTKYFLFIVLNCTSCLFENYEVGPINCGYNCWLIFHMWLFQSAMVGQSSGYNGFFFFSLFLINSRFYYILILTQLFSWGESIKSFVTRTTFRGIQSQRLRMLALLRLMPGFK